MDYKTELEPFYEKIYLAEFSLDECLKCYVNKLTSHVLPEHEFRVFLFGKLNHEFTNSIAHKKTEKLLKTSFSDTLKMYTKDVVDGIEYLADITHLTINEMPNFNSNGWMLIDKDKVLSDFPSDLSKILKVDRSVDLTTQVDTLLKYSKACARVWSWDRQPVLQIFVKM